MFEQILINLLGIIAVFLRLGRALLGHGQPGLAFGLPWIFWVPAVDLPAACRVFSFFPFFVSWPAGDLPGACRGSVPPKIFC